MPRTVTRQSSLASWVKTLVLPAVLWLAASTSAIADTPAQQMAQAIARMMESMGFTGAAGYDTAPAPPPVSPDVWPSPFGVWPGAQQAGEALSAGSGMPMEQMSQMGEALARGMPIPGARGVTRLEGVWEDNQGGLLIVQGSRYRLYAQCRGYIEGAIQVRDDRVELTNTRESITQTFELALDQGRLALRSPSGELFLYRRLVLGQER